MSTPRVSYLLFWFVGQTPIPHVESSRRLRFGNVIWNLEPNIFRIMFFTFINLQQDCQHVIL